ncbi:ASNA ATPase, partial [Bucco capensis]|nr:ASNA ATPase [Bucco capensis]
GPGPEADEFEDAPDVEPLEPTLANIIEQRSLKWIFVGGKGGVGKTTCRDAAVLLQGAEGTQGCAMGGSECCPPPPFRRVKGLRDAMGGSECCPPPHFRLLKGLRDAMGGVAPPRCRLVKGMNFSLVVFDTAPTGHTLRLLNFPSIVERGLGRLMQIKNQI